MVDMKIDDIEKKLETIFKKQEEIEYFNSKKVMDAFSSCGVNEACFNATTGYGYGDLGRDTLEEVYAHIFKSEDALVRVQFISGTHAISTALFALLRPGDLLLSITGRPYDTLASVIGISDNPSSLKAFNIKYDEIDLVNNAFDIPKIIDYLKNNKVKVIEIQRSIGYSMRKSISIEKLDEVIKEIRKVDQDVIIMVDNCYCEFVSTKEPIEVGADLCVGSLIKNLGGGIASNGGYIVGRKDLIRLCSERLNVAGEAKEVGPSLGFNKSLYQGLYMAPSVVTASLKTGILAAFILEEMGYEVNPKWNEDRADIVTSITFNDKDILIKFVQGIQSGSAIDSSSLPIPAPMPGYDDDIIMASGSFTQGSSIELSCDGPLREPYIAYLQGSLTYQYGKIGVLKAIESIKKY
ncbi:MAG TPA: methionine gamma-lyase family protein [Candidatus Onthocola stercorigallinarum]|nr:methionine gamma-lyase family protein [Candidatus Onthocola stercorigallinarum]